MRRVLIALSLSMLAAGAYAGDVSNLSGLTQAQFRNLSEDLGSITSYKQLQSAAPEGITGFDIGAAFSATDVAYPAAWTVATAGDSISTVPLVRVQASKGLPGGIDIGGFYATAPGSNVKLYGVEGRYAIWDGGVAEPALGVRASYTHVSGVDNLSFNTTGVDFSISKGFGPVTPYAGLGRVWVNSDPGAVTGLNKESFGQNHGFVGLDFSFLVVNVALEADRTGAANTYSLKFAAGF